MKVVGVNQPAELTCNVSGLLSPQLMTPSIRWTRNGIDIPVDAGRFYMPQLNVLRINRAAVTDSGMYQCFVRVDTTGQFQQQSVVSQALSGSYQHVQASAELIVRDSAPSRLTDVFNEQMVYPGRPAFLHCSVSSHGSPSPPSIAWTVDSLTIPYTSGRWGNASVIRMFPIILLFLLGGGGWFVFVPGCRHRRICWTTAPSSGVIWISVHPKWKMADCIVAPFFIRRWELDSWIIWIRFNWTGRNSTAPGWMFTVSPLFDGQATRQLWLARIIISTARLLVIQFNPSRG